MVFRTFRHCTSFTNESNIPLNYRDDIHEANALERLSDDVPRSKFAKLWAIVEFLDKYGVEAHGIERVPPDQRTQTCMTFSKL